MKIETVTTKKDWDRFILKENGSFLQSFDWGVFQEKQGNPVFRIAVRSKGETILQAQIIKEKLPFSKFYFQLPYGPVTKKGLTEDKRREAERMLVKQVSGKGAVFMIVEPLKEFFFGKKASFRIQPQKTSVIDLTKSIEDIFNSFKKDLRYSIRTAQKKGVELEEGPYDERFFDLLEKVKERKGFSSYHSSYFPELLDTVNSRFFFVSYEGKLVAGMIMVFFGDTVTSLHSASDYDYRHLQTPSLQRFHACLEGKKQGFAWHDLWGIEEEKYPGVANFKKKFCGREIVYPQGKVVVFSHFWYTLYIIAKKIKRIL